MDTNEQRRDGALGYSRVGVGQKLEISLRKKAFLKKIIVDGPSEKKTLYAGRSDTIAVQTSLSFLQMP